MLQVPSTWKIIAFTFNLIIGLGLSQGMGVILEKHAYDVWTEVVQAFTMWCLCFIMINVGFEFTIDKGSLSDYAWDSVIALSAACMPWMLVTGWIMVGIGGGLALEEVLLICLFAAATSAGILFSMLEGAGLKETWVFSKARILAIFDDLATIVLMIPLKVALVGVKWELFVLVAIMLGLLVLGWKKLHCVGLPHSWKWTLFYAAVVSGGCKLLYHVTHIHLEVLLPAFVLGCIIDTPAARHELKVQRAASELRRSKTLLNLEASDKVEQVQVNAEPPSPTLLDRRKSKNSSHSQISFDASLSIVPQVAQALALPPGAVQDDDLLIEDIEEGISPLKGKSTGASSHDLPLQMLIKQGVPSPMRQRTRAVLLSDVPRHKDDSQNMIKEKKSGELEASKSSRFHNEPVALPVQQLGAAAGQGVETLETGRSSVANINALSLAVEHVEEHVESPVEHMVQTVISLVFMVLVGLSMPLLVGPNAEGSGSDLSALALVGHIFGISILMVLGKMVPAFCYRDEANFRSRLALCVGMCPRGEVGASIIVIALELGVRGPAVLVAMGALTLNLVLSGGFITAVKFLLRKPVQNASDEV
mmetsp:Transcript_90456/g.193977  ORF Transcript_90456/g.193977 Transcript_90456/m.193977 type:complete len:590 (-) Transcript_90456:230-1999(-)